VTSEPAHGGREPGVKPSRTAEKPLAAVDTVVLAGGTLALVAVERTVSVLANVPFDPVVTPPLRAATGLLALVATVCTLTFVAVTDGRATVRTGLLFAAVFGCLPLVAPGTTLLAVVAVTGGSALALAGTLGLPEGWTYRGTRQRLVAAGVVVALAATLAGATGLLDGVRNPGAVLTLATLAAVGTRAEGSTLAGGAGLVAAGATVVASAASPFVVGSTLLVAFAVTGVPSLLVALAVAGVVAAAVAGLHRGEYTLAVGTGLLLVAGVPATFPRALVFLLGAALVVLDGPRDMVGPPAPTGGSA
jgi:hypothetical protein